MNKKIEQKTPYYEPGENTLITRFVPPPPPPLPLKQTNSSSRLHLKSHTGLNPSFSAGFILGMVFAWVNFIIFEWVMGGFYNLY